MGDIRMEIRLNLDEGFLRRKCPNCGREFKWHQSDTPAYPSEGQYYCPYCGQQGEGWLTEAQRKYILQNAGQKAVDLFSDKLRKAAQRVNKPGGLVRMSVSSRRSSSPTPPHEPHDMRRVEPPCHPLEPLKISEDWEGPLHCLICGAEFMPR